MRNVFRIILVGMLLATGIPLIVSAGGGAEEPIGPQEVTIWAWGGVDEKNEQIAGFREIDPELFEAVDPKYISAGGNDAEVYGALRLALAAGNDIPDVVRMNYTAVSEFASAGVLMDLSEYLEPYIDDMTQAGIELSRYGDQVIGIPIQAKSKLWFYRRDLFEQAGIDPNSVRTQEDFLLAAKRYREVHPNSYMLNLGPQPIHYWYFTALSNWADAQVATEDGEYLLTEHPAYETWLQFTKDLYDSGLTYRTDDWSPDWVPAFIDGEIGSWLGASWGWSYPVERWTEEPNPEQWGVALWPEFVRYGAEAGGEVAVIPVGASNPEAAVKYLVTQFLETEGAVSYFDTNGVVPTVKSALEVLSDRISSTRRPDGVSDVEWFSDPINFWGSTFVEMNSLSFDYFRIFPYDPSASLELDIIRQHTEALLAGDHETVDDALEAAQADMVQQIGNPYN